MIKIHCNFIIFFSLMYSFGVVGQSSPKLILPTDVNGTIKLHIPTTLKQNKKLLAYDGLAVFVKNEKNEYISNAIQGQHEVDGKFLLFKPYFPFESGMTYIIRTKNTNSESTYSYQSFQIENKKSFEEAKVVSIYPLSVRLPENLLRFYIYFNTPMKKGQALNHIKLVDEHGNVDNYAFMEFKQELWSIDGKRLTLLFDPGRIKRGVSTNMQKGPALLNEKQYYLSISGGWQDVYGQQLSLSINKKIEVEEAYRNNIKVNEWVINEPKANSRDTLTIYFDRIIDHALLQSMIKIVDTEEKQLSGYWEISVKERSINFIPKKEWRKGTYQIIIDSRLEDVAGNNLHNLLDPIKTIEEHIERAYHYIDFKI